MGASNDAGALGFVSDARRLNVLFTRQTIGLWIICDKRSILTLAAQAERDNLILGLSEADGKGQTGDTTEDAKAKKTGGAEKRHGHRHIRLDARKALGYL